MPLRFVSPCLNLQSSGKTVGSPRRLMRAIRSLCAHFVRILMPIH